jgi:hypothetical protein
LLNSGIYIRPWQLPKAQKRPPFCLKFNKKVVLIDFLEYYSKNLKNDGRKINHYSYKNKVNFSIYVA